MAVNLRGANELVGAVLCSADDDLLVSASRQSIRFSNDRRGLCDNLGRASGSGSNIDDRLLSLNVVRERTCSAGGDVRGYHAKRTAIEEYPVLGPRR